MPTKQPVPVIFIWLAYAVVLFAGVANASPITVTLTIPDANGYIDQPPGPGVPFAAPSITFMASGDTSAVHASGSGFAFDAPIVVLMPGLPDAEVAEPAYASASVSVYNVGVADGRLGFDWDSLPYLRQGAYVVDPTLLDYKFQASYGPRQVGAQTWNILPMGGAVSIRFTDGRSAVVAAQSGNSTLAVVITDESAAIPTLSTRLVVLLALLLSIAAGFILCPVRDASDRQKQR